MLTNIKEVNKVKLYILDFLFHLTNEDTYITVKYNNYDTFLNDLEIFDSDLYEKYNQDIPNVLYDLFRHRDIYYEFSKTTSDFRIKLNRRAFITRERLKYTGIKRFFNELFYTENNWLTHASLKPALKLNLFTIVMLGIFPITIMICLAILLL